MVRRRFTRSDLRPYQNRLVSAIKSNMNIAAWVDMGLGKTASTLAAMVDLIDDCAVESILIIGPKRVVEHTWPTEFKTWDFAERFVNDHSVCCGTEKKRIAALNSGKRIMLINRENVAWLVKYLKENKIRWPFDTVVIDESSSFKNMQADRTKQLARVVKKEGCILRLIQLTGTPGPNGYLDLFSQIYLLDKGESLGTSLSKFKEKYFVPDKWGRQWTLRKGAARQIEKKIAHLTLVMETEDYLDLPDFIVKQELVALSQRDMQKYESFAAEQVLDIAEEGEISAANAGVLYGKLTQFTGGFVYDQDKKVHQIHSAKLDTLADVKEAANGQNLLVAYQYQHERDAILKRFPEAEVLSDNDSIDRWNNGEISMFLVHPASGGHGLNLQHGGSILVWYSITSNLEHYQQFNKRLHRSGQKAKQVIAVHLVCENTVDEIAMSRIDSKGRMQKGLLEEVKRIGDEILNKKQAA